MRFFKVGIIFLFLLPTLTFAQVSGSVESIGIDGYFRPDCWTPMVISVTPESAKSESYQVHVKVQDMDRDLPVFMQTIPVTGGGENQNQPQKFRVYFIPPPTDHGLPDARDAGALQDLQERIKVSIYSGAKWICDLPITGTINNVDPNPGGFEARRGAKLIIAVSDGASKPVYQDNSSGALLGVMEDVDFVTIHPRDLPENVLGYDAVDGIVWLDADPAELKSDDEKLRAFKSYVRQGGRLVICQPADWQKTLAFDDMLPVTIKGVDQKDDLEPLRNLAKPITNADGQPQDPFAMLKPPFRFARAEALPNTVVDQTIEWGKNDESPYIVRMPYGLGAITWVAQDLGDPSLTLTKLGWVNVWQYVFDWKNTPLLATNRTRDEDRKVFEPAPPKDIGYTLLQKWMDLESRSAWMITLAILFFIGYWLLAGPGVYAYLAAKRKTQLSWFIYGLSAFVATALTVLIVKLVLRGPPQLIHFSVVRASPGVPAVVTSRIGLYIPRDGPQNIELHDQAPETVTSITALPVHPHFVTDAPAQTGPEYNVPVIDAASGKAASLSFNYRSTLKKFEAKWVGDVPGIVQGSAKLVPGTFIEGHLTNGTGQPLRNIYLAFNYPVEGGLHGDWILFLPTWDTSVTLDLNKEFNKTVDNGKEKDLPLYFTEPNLPDGTKKARGRIAQEWEPFWTGPLSGDALNDSYDDSRESFRRSLPMLSFFDRLAPLKNEQNKSRLELLRRGGRGLDVSANLAAGQLVVLAEADGPLPMPMTVEGTPVTGNGLIFYQFLLPLDHSAVATTQPTTQANAQ